MSNRELELLQERVISLRAEGKYKETIEESYKLLEKGQACNDQKSILVAHLGQAASFYCIGDIKEAFHSIEAYDEVCQKHGEEADWVNLYNLLFLLYEYKKDFEKARETLIKSIELGKKTKKYNIVSNGYSNLSHTYLVEKNFGKALEASKMGIEMAMLHKPKSEMLEIRVELNFAKSYIGLNKFEESKSIIDEILQNPILESFPREKTQCYDLLGTWYAEQNLYKEAYESFTFAKQQVEGYNDVYLLKAIQEERIRLCELMNDIKLGYGIQKEYIALLNEISDRELSLSALKLEVKHSISTIQKKANIDSLTGTYNRDYLENTVNEWLKQASFNNENIVCIVFDIDHFKHFNDEFGHLFGDEVIKQVSKACLSLLTEGEMIGRYGGDEFIVFLKGASIETGKKRAEQMERVIRNLQLHKDEKTISIQASIGIADNSNGALKTFEELFNLADTALYKAKKSGKNQICVIK